MIHNVFYMGSAQGLHSVCTVFCMGSAQGLHSVLYGVYTGSAQCLHNNLNEAILNSPFPPSLKRPRLL